MYVYVYVCMSAYRCFVLWYAVQSVGIS